MLHQLLFSPIIPLHVACFAPLQKQASGVYLFAGYIREFSFQRGIVSAA
jgi:hypothetical protein